MDIGTWTTGDWALFVSALTFALAVGVGLYTRQSAVSTKQYAEDTRKLVDAALYTVLDVGLSCIAAGEALTKTHNPETYINLRLTNTHATVDALDLKFEIELGVIMDKHVGGKYIERTKLNYKMYHKEFIGTLVAREKCAQEVQFGENQYEPGSGGTQPSGPGLETFIRDYLPEFREQQVTGKLVDNWLGMRLTYSFRPASYGAQIFSHTEYHTISVSFNQKNMLSLCIILAPEKA